MARLEERDYTYFSTVQGMCRTCREIAPARVYFKDNQVWQQSLCPNCENTPALIAGDQKWYLEKVSQPQSDCSPIKGAKPSKNGCPHDCGPCNWHASPCQLPVISVTNACNLDCPICFTYNRKDKIYYKSPEEMKELVDWIVESSGIVDLINITGGEPTLHPQIFELIELCRRPEIGRVTLNSNGIKLAEDQDFCNKLGELGVYVILSFNTFDSDVSKKLHGRDLVGIKLKAIENLTKAGVRMTLLNVMIRNTNENAISGIFDLMRKNDNILSLTVQTMTYTGQGGGEFGDRHHLPVDEAARIVCEQSNGELCFEDFVTPPSAHPLCYLTSYMMKSKDKFLPFRRFAGEDDISKMQADSYLLKIENERRFFSEAINKLYAEGDTDSLKVFKELIKDLHPQGEELSTFERQKRAESSIRTVYIHSHMDENNFDSSRAMCCPDLVPDAPGCFIPACTYNLFYRMKDERFYVDIKPE